MLFAASVWALAFTLGPPARLGCASLQPSNSARAWSRKPAMVSTERDASTEADCVGAECDVPETPVAPVATPLPSTGGQTIDMRRGRTGTVGSSPAEQRSYGRDPRTANGKPEQEAIDLGIVEAEGPHPSASSMHEIRPLRSVTELEAAIEKAGDSRLVVLKFYARWCKSCKAIKPRFERIVTKLGDSCDFYEVDYAAHKAFCERCAARMYVCM